MRRGFFNRTAVTSKAPLSLIPLCGKCKLKQFCNSPMMPASGEGQRRVLLLGEAPAYNEDQHGRQFVGKAGELLQEVLEEIDVDLRRDCWITNSVICMPKGKNGKWRNPTPKEIDYCRPTVISTINRFDPDVIIPLGAKAVRSLIGWVWDATETGHGGIGRWAGFRIPCRKPNAWICPTFHPSFVQRAQEERGKGELIRESWTRDLYRAFRCAERGKPWETLPEAYEKRVQAVMDPNDAAALIRRFTNYRKPVAWDYETDGLKPDSVELDILTCGMSDGETSFAFPWHGAAITATKEFLQSSTPKIGFNIEYEYRWSLAKLGVRTQNVVWDGMQTAHVLDSRRGGICSVEFQEFVLLGVTDHKRWVKPFMKAMDKKNQNNTRNRLREVHLPRLLVYNATDALVEWEIAQWQAKKLGIKL